MRHATRNAVRNGIRSAFGRGAELAHRYIRTFNGSTTYGTLNDTVTFTGDYEVEFSFACTDVTANRRIVGSPTNLYALYLDTNGFLLARLQDGGGAFTITLSTDFSDGLLYTGKLTKVGDDFALTCDGGSTSTNKPGALAPTYSEIGSTAGGTTPFNGEILSVKFTDKSGASDVVTNYVLDNDSLVYQQARGYGLGSELIANGTFDTDTEWTKGDGWSISGGVASSDGTQTTVSSLSQTDNTSDGSVYVATIIVSNLTAGTVRMKVGGVYGDTINANGTYTQVIVAGAGGLQLVEASTGFIGDIDNFSIKASPKALVYSNFIASDIEQYTYNQQAVRWEGVDVVVNGGFDTDTDWNKGDGWTISGGVASCDGTQTTTSQLSQLFTFTDGKYLTAYDLLNYSAGTMSIRIGSFGTTTFRSANGTYSEVTTYSGGISHQMVANTDFIGSIDNVSVKRVLEYN